jgi:hypothetical protein
MPLDPTHVRLKRTRFKCSLQANTRVTNGIPLGSSLLLPVDTVNFVQTLKGPKFQEPMQWPSIRWLAFYNSLFRSGAVRVRVGLGLGGLDSTGNLVSNAGHKDGLAAFCC